VSVKNIAVARESMEMTVVYTFRGGLIFGAEFFWDHAEALEAAGISE
jgi:hypothetical protein